MQSNQLVNFANEFDFLPDLARAAAAEVRRPETGIARPKALDAAGDALVPAPSPPEQITARNWSSTQLWDGSFPVQIGFCGCLLYSSASPL